VTGAAAARGIGIRRAIPVYGCGILTFAIPASFGPVIPAISQAFTVPVETVGLAIGAQMLPTFLFAAPIGRVIDRIGARRALQAAAVILLATGCLLFAAASVPEFVAALLLQGVALTLAMNAGPVVLSLEAADDRRRDQMLALWAMAPFVGAGGGIALAGWLANVGWQRLFAIQAAAALILTLGLVLTRNRRAGAGRSHRAASAPVTQPEGSLRRLLAERGAVILGCAMALATLIGQGSNAVLPLFLSEQRGLSIAAASAALALANLLGILGGICVGAALSRRVSQVAIASCVAIAGGVAAASLFVLARDAYLLQLLLIASSIATGAAVALSITVLPRVVSTPARFGFAAGAFNQLGGLGALLAAPVFLRLFHLGGGAVLALTAASGWAAFAGLIHLSQRAAGAATGGRLSVAPDPVEGASLAKSPVR
jgi:predicted MFS family arabinose efflux permease